MTVDVPTPPEIASHEIIRSLVGSTMHGTGLPGAEDTDYMGVCVEPWQAVLGLDRFEQWEWRSAGKGERSGPDDVDVVVYGLGKYLRLAAKGNPSILLLLFAEDEFLTVDTEWGVALQNMTPAIVSRQVAGPFMGYCNQQRQRLEGVRGGRHTNRPELVEAHGYDTKYAMHALRLAYQGQEILRTGRLTLPIPSPTGDILRAVRRGDIGYEDFMELLAAEQKCLELAARDSTLPERPDFDALNRFARATRLGVWAST